MKAIYYISVLSLIFAFALDGFSQEPPQRRTRQRPSEAAANNSPVLTERARIKNEETSKGPAHIVWLRELYRYIDLDKEQNAPLLYPTEPMGDRQNLFSLIFRLVADGRVNAYNYGEGKESFTEDQKINFEDILKRQQILYTTQGTGANARFVVEDVDIPSSEVLLYMIKEAWYFDEATGTFKSQVLAMCPILVREDYYSGGITREALFWVVYEDIRPYISRELIMTSNFNNALTYTIDDFFTKRMYDGEIVKTVNLKNQSLAQQVGSDPEVLKLAQDSIENQLKFFEKQLWVPEDTTTVVDKKDKEKKTTSARNSKSKEKEAKPKAAKEEKSSSPTRSVRRR